MPLASLGTSLAEWELALEPFIARFSQVPTGYGSHLEPCSSVVGWRFSDDQALFATVGEGGLVGPVWLCSTALPSSASSCGADCSGPCHGPPN